MREQVSNSHRKLIDVARRLVQVRGFNGFSFRDLAEAVGIRSASVHYHFPTKEHLGVQLVREYGREMEDRFEDWRVAHPEDPEARLRAFVELFASTAKEGDRLCLAGMLGSDFETLGEELRIDVRDFFMAVERWIARQFAACDPSGARSISDNRRLASTLLAALEGALVSARVFGEPARVRRAGLDVLRLVTS